ncbi:MAG: formate dehydrogenase subunit delta [Xanthomonadales bacterium]|uniref:formate dehydrogenase subunit delta n=1 Tax=Dokdonella sp. TaxID=2291710 RepID=UPI002D12E95A|nr:formate dehydrogenase subunit delta [Xanthomonadales bacterium]HQV50405.1 formate dehydrogenase subunit delta [Dokdonella sp.]MBK7012200.1 formate dehydrogenase subunit delta [Xanthomonadales bacterium]MBK7209723.1 formate dehydrogenase subunit delta [Xanthomonadales bacterium]MBL0222376.1 formate dehydrogenase subunit delta [Xanthomonadales bacterium]
MDVQRLVAMANDIARYFASEPERDAGIEGVADHLRKFWTPRMCEQLVAHVEIDDSGLDALAAAGVRRLAARRQDA